MSGYCTECGSPLLVDFLSGLTQTCNFCTGRKKSTYKPDVPDWEAMTIEEIITIWRLTLYLAPSFTEEVNGLIVERMRLIPVTVSETGAIPMQIDTPPPSITEAPYWVQQWIFPMFSRQHKKRRGSG